MTILFHQFSSWYLHPVFNGLTPLEVFNGSTFFLQFLDRIHSNSDVFIDKISRDFCVTAVGFYTRGSHGFIAH